MSHDDSPECEHLTGRLRAICRGEAGLPLNGRNSTNAYRQSWGLPPLETPQRSQQTTGKRPTQAKSRKAAPGTHLKRILHTMGIPSAWCDGCTGRARQMDAWGIDGCRQRIDLIAGWLRDAAATQTLATKAAAAWHAVIGGVWVNPLDPYRGLVLRAIEAAERERSEAAEMVDTPQATR